MHRFAILAAALLAAPASAATLTVVSGSGQRGVTIASADPLGQSFTALDNRLDSFGFQFTQLNASAAIEPITFEILEGEGFTGRQVYTTSFTLPTTVNSRTPVWYDITLPGVPLTVGGKYSALLSTGTSLRYAIVYGPDINLSTGVAQGPDAYAGGRFLFTGSVGGRNCDPAASICDTNFRMTGRTVAEAAVPEPASWAMMIGGFGLVGGALRRRSLAIA